MLTTLLTLQSENHSNLNPKPKITMVDKKKTIYLVCNLSFKGTTTKKHFATNEVYVQKTHKMKFTLLKIIAKKWQLITSHIRISWHVGSFSMSKC